ncbi:MAG: hypothetical protein FWB96_06350 [Defluviitaleaceae bacterium]|nr:hypothetical protein [Defluviitaleaceae bacterium]MCL2263513.1 hypothetical protein [Defluviitaleaceae bacterium]
MKKLNRIFYAIAFMSCMFLFTACAETRPVTAGATEIQNAPVREWAGHELVRENLQGNRHSVTVPNNVITTEDETLVLYYVNRSGSDAKLFGAEEFLQVQLDGVWYTLEGFLPERAEPLRLPPAAVGGNDEVRHEINFPNPLPTGRYRFADNLFNERMQMSETVTAYFWVTEPGAERPPESETTGTARLEDINLTVTAVNSVRTQVTDTDEYLFFHIENLSGKDYLTTAVSLAVYAEGTWHAIPFDHANMGLQFGWTHWANQIFLYEPLSSGDYRITLTMNVFNTLGNIYPQYTFSVISSEDAPEPVWDATRLSRSRITEISTNVTMTPTNDILTRENPTLELVLEEVDRQYTYGMPFSIEVKLDGEWFEVPFAVAFFHLGGMIINQITPLESRTIQRDFVNFVGTVPTGQYRIIKEFNAWGHGFPPQNLAREIAVAEFTVAEVLE